MRKCANISPNIGRPLVIYDFATAPLWISLYTRKILFSFLSVGTLDSLRKLSWFVSYRRLSPQFQFFLSAVTLGIFLGGCGGWRGEGTEKGNGGEGGGEATTCLSISQPTSQVAAWWVQWVYTGFRPPLSKFTVKYLCIYCTTGKQYGGFNVFASYSITI